MYTNYQVSSIYGNTIEFVYVTQSEIEVNASIMVQYFKGVVLRRVLQTRTSIDLYCKWSISVSKIYFYMKTL